MNNLNVIVLGDGGMLSQDLLELLAYEDSIFARGYTEEQCDITKDEDLYNALEGTKGSISHVINCAAYTNVDGAEDHEKLAFEVNDKAVAKLAKVCKDNEIHLTHISTDYVFEGLKKEPYLEQDETYPMSVYGKSKLAGEGHVLALGNKGLVIRSAWLYGKHGKNFIDTILNKLDLGVDVNVVDDQTGAPTYTMDLANVIIQLMSSFKSGIFHATNSGHCNWFEFALEAAKLMKYNISHLKRIKTIDLDRKAQRPKYSVLSMNRLERTLPEPVRSWQDALYQYLIETRRIYEG